MTTKTDKERIKFLFQRKCELMSLSLTKAARMAGINPGAVSAVFNGSYQSDDTPVYRKLAIWVEYRASDWESAPTKNLQLIENLLDQAKLHSQAYAMVGPAGCGKSHALRQYSTSHKNVVILTCGEYWNKNDFLKEILIQLGKDYRGLTVSEKMAVILREFLSLDNPLLIIDEADKLMDNVFIFFITLYNRLEDNCGLVLAATDHLTHRIDRGLRYNKKGYAEIHSRICRRPVELNKISPRDVSAICEANGIVDQEIVEQIARDCEGDLRRVKRAVHVKKLENMQEG